MNPNIVELSFTNEVQGCLVSGVLYKTLSCRVPPNLIFNGENAAAIQIHTINNN